MRASQVAGPPVGQTLRLGDASGKWVLLATVLGSSLAGIDATVVNIALPSLGRDLHADFAGLQWTINGYTLTLAALILLGGSLGDRYGRRRIFALGTLWFAVASALCALAPTIEVLVAARALQGVGGALLTPGSLAIISASFSEDDRGKAIGAWSGFGGIATAIGPFLGGYLVAGPGWRWIFLINLPLALLVVAIAQRHVPETRDPDAVKQLDLLGTALGAIGLGGVTYALIGAGGGWSASSVGSGIVGLAALAGFVVNERRSAHPMLPPGIFANRQFTAANVVTFLVYGALGGVFFFVVVDLQVVAGFSPLLAGTSLLPITAIMLAFSARAGDLAGRIGPRVPMSLGPVISAGGLLLLLRIGPNASYVADVLPGVTVFGFGLTLIVAPLTTTVLAAAEERYAGIASGVNNAVARAAALLAVAVLPALVGISGDDYQHPEAFAAGFRIAVILSASLLVLGGVLAAASIRNPHPRRTAGLPASCHFCALDGPPHGVARGSRSRGAVGVLERDENGR
jgi:EmrB/QacA subfamily drug resistance transporter